MKARFLFLGAAVGSILVSGRGAEADAASLQPDDPGAVVSPAAAAAPRRGMKRWKGDLPNRFVTPTCKSPKLSYYDGPIVQNPIVIPVFWNSNVNSEVQSNMSQFYSDIMASPYWGWLTEYNTVGISGGSNQAILPGTSMAGVVITPTHCPASTTSTCKLTDTELQAELVRQIGLGTLPAPVQDCTGNTQTIYMVDFPPNVSLSGPDGSGTSCSNGGFCAYHNTGTYGANSIPLLYGALMDQYSGGCAQGCGTNNTVLESMTETASHELIEATTDPDIGLIPTTATNIEAPAGWYDQSNNCGEIADICDTGTGGDTITVSGRTWTVQEVWSNKQGKCSSTGTTPTVCSGTTITGCRLCSCGDNGAACNGGTAVCETGSSNVLFGGCEQCTSTTTTACGGGTCEQSSTPAQDDVCSCVPKTTCPAGDDCGTAGDGCGGTVTCGSCTAPQTCGGGSPSNPNVCGCTPATTCPSGDACGTAADGCGGMVTCGTCGANEVCTANQCVATSTSTSTSSGTGSSTSGGNTSSSGGVGGSTASTSSSSGGVGGSSQSTSGATGSTGSGTFDAPGQTGGCNCETAGQPRGSSSASLSALGLLALAGVVRARKRRSL